MLSEWNFQDNGGMIGSNSKNGLVLVTDAW